MTWTCEQTEARLSDYLDGLLDAAEWGAFNQHVNTCAVCTPLVASVAHTLGGLYSLEQVEAPPQLETKILIATVGVARTKFDFSAWLRSFLSPRFVYGAVSVAATIALLLTATGFNWRRPKLADLAPATIYHRADSTIHVTYARSVKFVSDLRVVYEIQSRMNEDNQNPAMREETIPQSSPKKEPGRTDNTNPSTPKQQNRADDISRRLEVLACEFPILSGSLEDRRVR
ncbi:MAG TPA: zf-HC2 domain-containing protein [Candidatus Acidoferrum sp.]|nr:zf-HC2 domain-containing protein [Candidatus Acidoferrum sp.]